MIHNLTVTKRPPASTDDSDHPEDSRLDLPHFPNILMFSGVAIAIIIAVTLVMGVYNIRGSVQHLMDRETTMVSLRGKILHLDEVLTMSARLAVSTGDAAWIERYTENEPKLGNAINEAKTKTESSAVLAAIFSTDEANHKLVSMESRAFELIRKGKKNAAWDLLNSATYAREKSIYAEGMQGMYKALDKEKQQIRAVLNESILTIAVGGFLSALALLVTILFLMKSVNRWRAAMTKLYQKLRETHKSAEKARDAAEAANKVKGEFLANMSHEIRTPMNGVIGMCHLALQSELPPKGRGYVKKASVSAKNLLHIINDILDFSKLEADHLELEEIDFSLEKLISEVGSMLSTSIRGKDLEFLIDLDSRIPLALRGDPVRLTQVLSNLCNNAIKFTSSGEVSLKVRMEEKQSDHVRLHFSVQDTGMGIPQSVQNTLFESFTQTDNSITRQFGGTGLGLAIVKRILLLMDSEITLTSEVGKGSIFEFSLDMPIGRSELLQQVGHGRKTCFQGLSALIVDDNANARLILEENLRHLGFDVVLSSSGEEAIAEVKRSAKLNDRFDIIIMDWMMPGLNGLQTIKQINEVYGFCSKSPVIMVTAYDETELTRDADTMHLEVAGVLTKPVSPSSLIDELLPIFGEEYQQTLEGDLRSPVVCFDRQSVLLVEDNVTNQEVITALCEERNLIVQIAENGMEALEAIENQEQGACYSAIIMDVHMPVMNGYDATREIRKRFPKMAIPIIGASANAMAQDRQKSIDAGMNDYITKPIDVKQLEQALVRWIKPTTRNNTPSTEEATEHAIGGKAATDEATSQACADNSDLVTPVYNLDTLSAAGINVALSLRRMGGNERIYRKLLTSFLDNNVGSAQEIDANLADKHFKAARLRAHSIKGLAANIGLESLQTIAHKLEQACHCEDKEESTRLLVTFRSELEDAVTLLRKTIPS